jgi:hypothetical protein
VDLGTSVFVDLMSCLVSSRGLLVVGLERSYFCLWLFLGAFAGFVCVWSMICVSWDVCVSLSVSLALLVLRFVNCVVSVVAIATCVLGSCFRPFCRCQYGIAMAWGVLGCKCDLCNRSSSRWLELVSG